MAEETKQCTTCGRRFSDDALFCPKDGSALVPIAAAKGKDALVGREILGHIEVRSLIGSGAMGRVYRAYQKGIDRDVAVKILHKELTANPDLVARFLREAKVASRLQHPNLVQVLLAGQLDDGTMYLVMEHLDGISLHSALMAAGGALPIGRALHIALQVCDAVGEAHAVGVVHRDVKPENVMLVKRGDDQDFVKVLDFGIARLGQKETTLETQAGLVFGTARYLSPEGARGEPVGPTSDVYAIATVVYQMLAGRTPFEHDSSVSLLVAQIHDTPPMLRSVPRASYVPKAIEAAIMKNLSKDASTRDVDGHSFGRALLDAAALSGFAQDDLLYRPAVARSRRAPSLAPQLPPNEKTREQPFGKDGLVAAEAAVEKSNEPPPVYHPSYSGRPGVVAQGAPPPRKVALTIDDDATPLAPVVEPTPPIADPKAATIGMSPTPLPPKVVVATHASSSPSPAPPPPPASDSILGTASSPHRDESARPIPGVPRRGRIAATLLVLVLLSVAVIGVGGYRLGYFGKPSAPTRRAEVDDLLARAQTALEARNWDQPAGENVIELTDKLLTLAPGETRTYQIRSQAADRILHEALEAYAKKDHVEALRLYKLAAHLSPPDEGIQEEIERLEADIAADPNNFDKVTDGGLSQYVVSQLKIGVDNDTDGINPLEVAPLVAVIQDGPGQGFADPKSVDPKAHFLVSGPGLDKPIELPAKPEGTTRYTASYAFKQVGSYRVFFFARPDGFPVKGEAEAKVVARKGTTAPSVKTTGTLHTTPFPTGTVILTPDPTVPLPLPTTTSPPPPTLPTFQP